VFRGHDLALASSRFLFEVSRMKRSPDLARVVERMAPGVLCRDGFLGTDPRPLEEVLDADRSAVAALGTSHEALAARLQAVYDQARAALGRPVEIRPGLTAVFHEVMGRIPSPWPGDGVFPKGDVELTGAASAAPLRFTALSIALIRAHGFYQGAGSPYRLDPARLAAVLGH
jgi:hypothetical protein